MSKFVAVGLVVVIAALLLIGCSGTNNQTVYQWVLERVCYNLAATRVAFTSLGGNGVRYVYSVTNTGGNLTLLTPTDNDEDLTDEGGKQPAYSPDGVDMAIVARRGGGQQSLYLIDPTSGAGTREARLTADNVALPGADAQPSWSADSSQIVYVSTKGSAAGRWEIWIVNRDGSNPHMVARTGAPDVDATDAQWPVFSPDGTQIIYQSRIDAIGVDTSLRRVNVAGGASAEIDGTENDGFREGAPSVVNVGATPVVVFSSNRNGDFDIWRMNLDGSDAPGVALTDDARSDGFPVWAADASRIAFTRDNEVWTIAANGLDPVQVTERFQNR